MTRYRDDEKFKKRKLIKAKPNETKEERLERLINNFLVESKERQKYIKRFFISKNRRKKKK